MRFSKLNRKIHRWGALLTALPTLVIIGAGLLLMLKKEVDWIQPPTVKGGKGEIALTLPDILDRVRSVEKAEVASWDDVDRLDVRPGKRMVKVRTNSGWEVQVDLTDGTILQTAYRRSDLIESIHDGSFFGTKLWLFLPTGVVLLALWGTGLYLFFLPYLNRRKNSR